MKKILHLNTSDQGGGAELIATRMHEHHLEVGWDSQFITSPFCRTPTVKQSRSLYDSAAGSFQKLSRLVPEFVSLQSISRFLDDPLRVYNRYSGYDYPGWRSRAALGSESADIVMAHNIHGHFPWLDIKELARLSHRIPTMLYLHDEFLLTGHCACHLDCDRWRTGCGFCPRLDIYPKVLKDRTRDNWLRRKQAFEQGKFHVIAPSDYMLKQCQASPIISQAKSIQRIHHGTDLSTFCPAKDRLLLRSRLGIPVEHFIILFAANGIRGNPWRDFNLLRNSLLAWSSQGIPTTCVAVGGTSEKEIIGNIAIHYVPFVSQREVIASYYQAADCLVNLARSEAFGLTMIEAMACGTPTIGTNVGAIPEVIGDDSGHAAGFILAENEVNELVNCFFKVRSASNGYRDQCVQRAHRLFDEKRQWREVDQYVSGLLGT